MKCALGIFCIGGLAYNAIEILWRGYTHWSMFIVGGACFQIIGRVQNAFRHVSLFRRCVLCSAAITAVEFASGCLFNLHMNSMYGITARCSAISTDRYVYYIVCCGAV